MAEINAFRKEMGLTVPAFAKTLGISTSYAVQMLYGKKRVTLNVLKRIKEAFPDADISRFV